MQVKNRLPAVAPRIGYNTIPRLGKAFVHRNLPAGEEQPTEQGLIGFAEVLHRRNVPIGDDQSMNRDRKSTRLNSSHIPLSRMPSSA